MPYPNYNAQHRGRKSPPGRLSCFSRHGSGRSGHLEIALDPADRLQAIAHDPADSRGEDRPDLVAEVVIAVAGRAGLPVEAAVKGADAAGPADLEPSSLAALADAFTPPTPGWKPPSPPPTSSMVTATTPVIPRSTPPISRTTMPTPPVIPRSTIPISDRKLPTTWSPDSNLVAMPVSSPPKILTRFRMPLMNLTVTLATLLTTDDLRRPLLLPTINLERKSSFTINQKTAGQG